MNAVTRPFAISALLLITLVFASGCIIAASHDGDITAPIILTDADAMESIYQAADDSDWDRICDMVKAQPSLAKICFDKHERDTLLHMAAADGNVKTVKALIAKGAYINGRNSDKKTPLFRCADNGNCEIAHLLINAGADITAVDAENYSALHMAAKWGHTEIVRLLLSRDANINALNNEGYSPLHLACMDNRTENAKLLLEHGAKANNGFDDLGSTPLHWAAWNGNDEIVELLIAKGADVNAHKFEEEYFENDDGEWRSFFDHGETPLFDAETISTAKILRKHGAKLNKHDMDLCVFLLFDCIENVPEDEDEARIKVYDEIALMLAKGVDINVREDEDNKSALSTAIYHIALYPHPNSVNLVKFLIENGADVNDRCSLPEALLWLQEPDTPQEFAIAKEIVILLINAGADVNMKYDDDETLLHFAAESDSTEIVELLLKHGADVNATNEIGRTPLDAVYNSKEIRELLKKHGAKMGWELKEEQEAKEEADQAKQP